MFVLWIIDENYFIVLMCAETCRYFESLRKPENVFTLYSSPHYSTPFISIFIFTNMQQKQKKWSQWSTILCYYVVLDVDKKQNLRN